MTERRKMYAPALIWSVTISSGVWGFSRNAVTLPLSSVGTSPKARGSSTRVRWRETSAPDSACEATRARMSRPVRMSPLKMSTGSSGPAVSRDATLRIAPPVPSGSCSVTYSMCRPSDEPSPKYGSKTSARYDVASTMCSTPAARARASWWVRNGTPAAGTMGLGVCTVSGRSRVPFPPTRRIASFASVTALTLLPAGAWPGFGWPVYADRVVRPGRRPAADFVVQRPWSLAELVRAEPSFL